MRSISPSFDPPTATKHHAPAGCCFGLSGRPSNRSNDTLKDQLGLEHHGGRITEGVAVRVLQRILALTAAIWHNWHTCQPIMRSLIAYDH
jgi:hypothetical protein